MVNFVHCFPKSVLVSKKPCFLGFALLFFPALILGLPQTGFSKTSSSGTVGLDTVGYLGSAHADRTSSFSSVYLNWEGRGEGPYLESALQSKMMLNVLQTAYSFVELPEIYVSTSPQLSQTRLYLGRKILSWSEVDSAWALGVWQPRFRWDYLDPAQVGLFGAFLKTQWSFGELNVFGSPIFIPERGVPVEFRDGVFTSHSPWFMSLPAKARLVETAKEPTPIHYALVAPPVSEIIGYPGGGASVRLGGKEGFWGRTGFAFKPINQLLIGYDGYNRLDRGWIEANLYPRVAYHALTALDVGFSDSFFEGWFSGLSERPIRDRTPLEWRTQELAPALVVGTGLGWMPSGKGRGSQFELSVLREWGGDAPDGGTDAMPGMNSFESRYPFKDTVRLGLRSPFSVLNKRFRFKSRLLYDFQNEGAIFSAEIAFQPTEAWAILVGTDILGSSRQNQKGMNVDFISRYRANDRVHGGISYVF